MNRFYGFYTLWRKEVLRFAKVWIQTILAPVVMALLYLLVFQHVLEGHIEVYGGISYSSFLIPGLVMMGMLQNAFANTSSSMIQSKMTGNIIFMLLTPLSSLEIFIAYTTAAIVRAILVGIGVGIASFFLVGIEIVNPLITLLFAILNGAILGVLGLIAGIWADKYDHLAAFQNFLVMPLTFLSGVFYSINSLPEFWQNMSHFNPIFYMIDGFRYGFIGMSDVSPWLSFAVSFATLIVVSVWCMALLVSGYKLRQ